MSNIDLKRENIKPLPVTVLSGFLGAGKTTLLENILVNRDGLKVALIVNDMSEINIDATLIEKGNASINYKEEKMVSMSNGCICCTLREDLLEEVTKLAKLGKFDYLIIESSGISEPLPVAETFTFQDNSGNSLSKFACLDTMVTVVDGYNFLKNYNLGEGYGLGSIDTLSDRGIGNDEKDNRTIVHLLTDQVEFANVILLNKIDLLNKDEVLKVRGFLQHINPTAKIYETVNSEIPLKSVLNTGLFNFREAECNPGWLREIRGQHIPESEEYGITSFVYRNKLPFHPKRLYDLLFSPNSKLLNIQKKLYECKDNIDKEDEVFIPLLSVVRSKGFCWIGTRPDMSGVWAQAGRVFNLSGGVPWFAAVPEEFWPEGLVEKIKGPQWDDTYGDRMQEIVIIGINLDKKGVSQALDTCLMTQTEIERENIIDAVSIIPLDKIIPEELEIMVDKSGEQFFTQPKNNYLGLDDPFPKWIH